MPRNPATQLCARESIARTYCRLHAMASSPRTISRPPRGRYRRGRGTPNGQPGSFAGRPRIARQDDDTTLAPPYVASQQSALLPERHNMLKRWILITLAAGGALAAFAATSAGSPSGAIHIYEASVKGPGAPGTVVITGAIN